MWEALNAEAATTEGEVNDKIGLNDIVGINVVRESVLQVKVSTIELSEGEVDPWLEQEGQPGKRTGRILIGNQAKWNDLLNPEEDVAQVKFSRQRLCRTHIQLPSKNASQAFRADLLVPRLRRMSLGLRGPRSSSIRRAIDLRRHRIIQRADRLLSWLQRCGKIGIHR